MSIDDKFVSFVDNPFQVRKWYNNLIYDTSVLCKGRGQGEFFIMIKINKYLENIGLTQDDLPRIL